jgi:hypothetical protein
VNITQTRLKLVLDRVLEPEPLTISAALTQMSKVNAIGSLCSLDASGSELELISKAWAVVDVRIKLLSGEGRV